jgi:hypothetical protein
MLNIHLKEHQAAYNATMRVTTIAPSTRPRISNASLISSLAIFLIFLWRCHDGRFLFFVPDRWSGFKESGGKTCDVEPRRSHLESCGSWYGAGSRKLVMPEFLVREMAFWVSIRKRETRKEVNRKGVRMIWGRSV